MSASAESSKPAPIKRWKCSVCGYIHEGDQPPDECPVCESPREKFELLPD